MNKAIKLVIEKGGYPAIWYEKYQYARFKWQNSEDHLEERDFVLDPLFWQALGRAKNWGDGLLNMKWVEDDDKGMEFRTQRMPKTLFYALKYFNVVLTGEDQSKFWEELGL